MAKKSSWEYAILATFGLRFALGLTVYIAWSYIRPIAESVLLSGLDKSLYGKVMVYQTPPLDGCSPPGFDGMQYINLNIAQFGYHAHSEGTSVFYPLYPGLTRLFAILIGENYLLSALLVSSLSCIAYLAGFNFLTIELFGAEIAKWSLFVLLCYPLTVFLVAPYSESLYLALTIWMFLAAKRQKWWLVGILGFASGLTRGPAMLSSLALLTLLFTEQNKGARNLSNILSWEILSTLSPVAGGGFFLLWRHWQGYPPISQVLSAHGIELSNPIKAIAVAVSQWIRVRDFYTTIDILSAALFLFIMAIILFRKRYPLYLQIYYLSNLLLFLSKIHHQASSLQSISRYVLTLFPAFWVIGEWLSRQAPLFRFTFLIASFGFLLIFSALYAMWVFIG